MGRACGADGKTRIARKMLVGKSAGKDSWEDTGVEDKIVLK
jgi:hypothetical protein